VDVVVAGVVRHGVVVGHHPPPNRTEFDANPVVVAGVVRYSVGI